MKIEFKLNSNDKKELDLADDFCKLLVSNIKSDIINNVNFYKLDLYEDAIINSKWINWNKKPSHINMNKLVKYIIDNITYRSRRKHRYIIYINNQIIPKSNITIMQIARFLDKGNNKYKGTFFISKVFMKYRLNINKYWKSYCSLRLGRISTSEVVLIK